MNISFLFEANYYAKLHHRWSETEVASVNTSAIIQWFIKKKYKRLLHPCEFSHFLTNVSIKSSGEIDRNNETFTLRIVKGNLEKFKHLSLPENYFMENQITPASSYGQKPWMFFFYVRVFIIFLERESESLLANISTAFLGVHI